MLDLPTHQACQHEYRDVCDETGEANIECDLSAVAKGYGVDQVAEGLREEGVTRFMVEVGGEIVAVGLNQQGGPWRIAIERPVMAGGVQRVVLLRGHAMATSGDYRNVREVDGRIIGIGGRGPVTEQLQSQFFDCVYGRNPNHRDWLTYV